jgi:hypothetical protein
MLARRSLTEHSHSVLLERGFARLSSAELAKTIAPHLHELQQFVPGWGSLPRDPYLKDGGRYRARRHSCFVQSVERAELAQAEHRAHWQSTAYNALHGGMLRWFEPIETQLVQAAAWRELLLGLGGEFAAVRRVPQWFIEAHQFRIDTTGGVGRPTPEGAHRDGVDFVAIVFIDRQNVSGGETRVFEADGPNGVRFTLDEPWSALLLDDARVVHETTPIQPIDPSRPAHRDTLVLTYRAGGFQAPP